MIRDFSAVGVLHRSHSLSTLLHYLLFPYFYHFSIAHKTLLFYPLTIPPLLHFFHPLSLSIFDLFYAVSSSSSTLIIHHFLFYLIQPSHPSSISSSLLLMSPALSTLLPSMSLLAAASLLNMSDASDCSTCSSAFAPLHCSFNSSISVDNAL